MPSISVLLSFVAAASVIVVVPGPSVAYVVARAVEHGRGAAMLSVAGLELGSLVHLVATAAGITGLIAASPGAFIALRWAGALYLVGLGIQQLRRHRQLRTAATTGTARPTRRQLLRDGLMIDLLNPGTALFFLAFLPQFVDPNRPALPQILALGGCYLLLAIANDTAVALGAGSLRFLTGSDRARRRTTAATGLLYFGLAVAAVAV
ncbi:LysE family translocator [Nocardioides sp. BGMRC 2183]|nr:LysE family translocator [Nocardioides sp. BGMRC 2183]